ncbi:MAG: hypothetical protein KA144_05420 [Xanthomonadaceae bacterium]|nr:hypothetical protein [Xanthomonadaceae bacterium]MCC7247600.1 hypothetical protein [Lysobacter sp.]
MSEAIDDQAATQGETDSWARFAANGIAPTDRSQHAFERRIFWRRTIRQRWFWRHTLRVAAFLVCAHAIVAVSLVPIFGMLLAMFYAVFPPAASIAAYDAIQDAPLFALLCFALAIIATGTLWPIAKAVVNALPFFPRIFALLALAIWVPTLSAESLRWALIQHEIVQTQPQCHGARTLLASLRTRNEFLADFDHGRIPHAWMLKDGEVHLWSYRRLRFEPAPGWRGIANCADAARATDPLAGQRW